jgi:uncharacterized phage-associated protein
LDRADARGFAISNMALNKVLYFAHAWFLVSLKKSLIIQPFEAWQHGPLVQDVYHSFKKFGDKPITSRATRLDRTTAQYILCESRIEESELALLRDVTDHYAPIPAAKLRGMTHVSNGPWAKVWNYEGASNPGMIIPDASIGEFYRKKFAAAGETDAYPQSPESPSFCPVREQRPKNY